MCVSGVSSKFSIQKAHEAQLKMAERIIFEDKLPEKIRYVAGVDVSYVKHFSLGAVAVLDYATLELVESRTTLYKTRFPYIPTLLSFREIPPTILSVKKLQVQPDVFLVDGQGVAHPFRCGFASHLGLVLGKPTIGVAKSRLFGEVENAKSENDVAFLKHNNEIVGAVVRTKLGCKPVYVSVGHMISLKKAIEVVKHCTCQNRIPEPILKAHQIASARKRKIHIASAAKS